MAKEEDKIKDDAQVEAKIKILAEAYSAINPGDGVTPGVGELLDRIVSVANDVDASDVHIEPQEHNILVRYRIDGLLRRVALLSKELEQPLIFKVKVSSRLRTDEHFAPQDGKISFDFDGSRVDTRVSILPTTRGEKVVLRLLTTGTDDIDLEALGFRDRQLEIVTKSYKKPHGLILASGPTGSGKTTTLYSILKILNSDDINITTVEDPVEYDLKGVNHVQVNSKANLTFSTGLRSILRQDPDVLMLGEIRDQETARIATNAAMTGHLVLSTIHTNDAVTTVPRLIDMGIEPFLVSSTVNVVIAQRLARRLCKHCKLEEKLKKSEITEIKKMRPDVSALLKTGQKVYRAKGCDECGNTGYKGRVGLYEVFEVNRAIRDLVVQSATSDELFESARKSGMTLILEDGIDKVVGGLTSIEEVLRVTAIKD